MPTRILGIVIAAACSVSGTAKATTKSQAVRPGRASRRRGGDSQGASAAGRHRSVAPSLFQFTRQLAAGLVPGLEAYRVDKVQYGRNPKAGEYLINDRVVDAFRNFVRSDSESQLTSAQLDADLDFVKLRLREEIITAGFSNDAGARVLLDSDPQVLRALEALPDAKRLAESVRTGTSQS